MIVCPICEEESKEYHMSYTHPWCAAKTRKEMNRIDRITKWTRPIISKLKKEDKS